MSRSSTALNLCSGRPSAGLSSEIDNKMLSDRTNNLIPSYKTDNQITSDRTNASIVSNKNYNCKKHIQNNNDQEVCISTLTPFFTEQSIRATSSHSYVRNRLGIKVSDNITYKKFIKYVNNN